MHAVGRQARQNLKKRGDFVPDFCAVFRAVDPRLASFMEVESVVPAAGRRRCIMLSFNKGKVFYVDERLGPKS
jgi:hypothetical protein